MKNIYKISGKITLFFYLLFLYQAWHLCQYGGVRRHLLILILGVLGFLISFIFWLVSRRQRREDNPDYKMKKRVFGIEIIIVLISTIYFGGRIVYSAVPYHGALSWKIDELMREKKVSFAHNNFFEDGAEGVLTDLDEALTLPEELYIADSFQMTFDETGAIQTLETFIYGRDAKGEEKTYLVNYDADQDEKMSVWIDSEARADYDEDMRLEPMLRILQEADCEQQVEAWSKNRGTDIYELLYYGRRSFSQAEGLQYLPGDVDGDNADNGIRNFVQLSSGGEVVGFEVSLYIPTAEDVTPIRYIMEPEYISQEKLNEEQESVQADDAKDTENWTIDNSNGTMYFFLDDSIGWRLVVTDAAAGSRYYEMEKTVDGGTAWEKINTDPFLGTPGVTEGLVFFDEKFGVAGLTGASQSASRLYITRDGGESFTQLQLPVDMVTELPAIAEKYGFTAEDYDYCNMPEKEGDTLTIEVLTEAGEKEGIVFQSNDGGETWVYDHANN